MNPWLFRSAYDLWNTLEIGGQVARCYHGTISELKKSDLGADFRQIEQLCDMLVVQPNAPIGRLTPDLACVAGPVDTVILPGKIERVCAERVVRARWPVVRPFRITLLHRRCRSPTRTFHFLNDPCVSPPGQLF